MGDRRGAHRVFVGIPYEKKPLRRPRRGRKGNINLAGEVHTGFLWGYLMKRNHSGDLGVDGRAILT